MSKHWWRRQAAVDSCARIADSRVHGDPEFQPFVSEARTALARMPTDRP
jgi:hypothetical protein